MFKININFNKILRVHILFVAKKNQQNASNLRETVKRYLENRKKRLSPETPETGK